MVYITHFIKISERLYGIRWILSYKLCDRYAITVLNFQSYHLIQQNYNRRYVVLSMKARSLCVIIKATRHNSQSAEIRFHE